MTTLEKKVQLDVLIISKHAGFVRGMRDAFSAPGAYRLRLVETLADAKNFTDRRYDIIVYHGNETATLEWIGSIVHETGAETILISPAQEKPVKFNVHLVPSSANPAELVETVAELITVKGSAKAA